jgi:hypothetical protein
MGVEGIKENDGGVNSSMIYLIYCKNLFKYHNIHPEQQKGNKDKKRNTFIRV